MNVRGRLRDQAAHVDDVTNTVRQASVLVDKTYQWTLHRGFILPEVQPVEGLKFSKMAGKHVAFGGVQSSH